MNFVDTELFEQHQNHIQIENRKIDNIYVVNLDRSTERWNNMSFQLSGFPYNYSRLSGIDGVSLEITQRSDNTTFTGQQIKDGVHEIIKNETYHVNCHPHLNITAQENASFLYSPYPDWFVASAGEFGCSCSHRMAWKQSAQQQTSVTLILEDDIIIKDGFYEHTQLSLTNTPGDFDILYFYALDRNSDPRRNDSMYFGKSIREFDPIWGTQAYAISHKGAGKLANLTETMDWRGIDGNIIRKNRFLKIYYTPFHLIDHMGTSSDINAMGKRF